jgi:hypothetical protein
MTSEHASNCEFFIHGPARQPQRLVALVRKALQVEWSHIRSNLPETLVCRVIPRTRHQ